MSPTIKKTAKATDKESLIVLYSKRIDISIPGMSDAQLKKISSSKETSHLFSSPDQITSFHKLSDDSENATLEKARVAGASVQSQLRKFKSATIMNLTSHKELSLAAAEGLALASYGFTKYFTKKDDTKLKTINLCDAEVDKEEITELNNLVEATCVCRDLVNEPQHFLSAPQLSEEIKAAGKAAGFKVEVFSKKKIESLKMGGLLAVNKGSVDPCTFNIMEWKPKNANNSQPIVLVGKGVVYDTGGLSLKPTENSMDEMKADMAGSAAVIGAMHAVAKNKLPLHVVALVPATDNRPSLNAYAPGDVITMFDGTTVEVLNTDAEGRMILADALSYAKKYKPELVLDLATLTGSAVRALGLHGIAAMGSADDDTMNAIVESGFRTHERVAVQPFWDEYGEEVKSKIADLKNLGGPYAGHITAGKFLEHFTKEKGKHAYPWVHLDIAGPAFLHSADSYRTLGGSGSGVRLLFDFLKNA